MSQQELLARIAKVLESALDLAYMTHWVDVLRIREIWEKLLSEAEPLT